MGGVNWNFALSQNGAGMWYLKRQTWLTLKAATGIIDHGVKTRIAVEQRAKALVFKKNRRSSSLEIAQKCQISKSAVAWIYHACMQWACIANNNFTRPKGTEPSIWKLFPATGSHFPWFVYEIILCDIMRNELVPFYLHNSTVLSNSTHFKTLKST